MKGSAITDAENDATAQKGLPSDGVAQSQHGLCMCILPREGRRQYIEENMVITKQHGNCRLTDNESDGAGSANYESDAERGQW